MTTESNITIMLEMAQEELDTINKQVDQLSKKRDSWRAVIQSLQACVRLNSDDVDMDISDKSTNRITRLDELDVDLIGASNLYERIVRIGRVAESAGKLLNAAEIIKYLRNKGVTTGSVRNLSPNVYAVFRDHPAEFEKVSPGRFRYHTQETPVGAMELHSTNRSPIPLHIIDSDVNGGTGFYSRLSRNG